MSTVTVAELIARGARRIGGRTGTLGTVTVGASTTTAIMNGLINTTGDDTSYAADRLIFPESASGSQETLITTWTDASGRATFTNLTAAPVAADDYILVPREDYTLNEFLAALNKALTYSRRTYRYIIPTVPLLELYPLDRLDWLEGSGSVDAVWYSESPLMLHNEDFALWQNGSASAPDGWAVNGSGASVARVSGGLRSAFAARLTSGMGAAAYLSQSIPEALVQWLTRRTFPVYTPMRGGAWVSTSTASAVRVGIYDGSTTTYSDYIDGDGVPHFPTLSVTTNANQTDFELRLEVAAGGYSADWSFGGLMQNTLTMSQAYQIRDQGSQAYREYPVNHHIRNVGGVPTVELQRWPGNYGQLVVYSRRPFPQVDAMTDVVEEQHARAIEAGMLRYLLDSNKPGQDRVRLDRIMVEEASRWNRFMTNNVNLPVAKPMNTNMVGSA